jgi:hypothetical protein
VVELEEGVGLFHCSPKWIVAWLALWSVPPTDKMDEHFLSLYRAMPKGYGCVDACIKISQVADKDGKRNHQLFSECRNDDWWSKEVSRALFEFADCVAVCPHKMEFGDQFTFDEDMVELRDTTLDIELTVTVTKITNWVFLVNVVNELRPAERAEEENPQ